MKTTNDDGVEREGPALHARLLAWLVEALERLRPDWRACCNCGGERWREFRAGQRQCLRCKIVLRDAEAPLCPNIKQLAQLKRDLAAARQRINAELIAEAQELARRERPRPPAKIERTLAAMGR